MPNNLVRDVGEQGRLLNSDHELLNILINRQMEHERLISAALLNIDKHFEHIMFVLEKLYDRATA